MEELFFEIYPNGNFSDAENMLIKVNFSDGKMDVFFLSIIKPSSNSFFLT